MFNDKLGQISLERIKKKNKQEKSRKTQDISNFKNVNSYSLDPFKRYSTNIFTVSAEDIHVNYEEANPKNLIKKNNNFSFGNVEKDVYSPFDEMIFSKKARYKNFNKNTDQFLDNFYTSQERKNTKFDVLKRNSEITDLYNNYPFPRENVDYLKCSIGESLEDKQSNSPIVSSFYEDFDSKDPFIDSHQNTFKGGVYLSNKTNYNKGKNKPFAEKDNVKNNSIITSKNENSQYYKDSKLFKTSGFVYKSKRPESIAFGGLKR